MEPLPQVTTCEAPAPNDIYSKVRTQTGSCTPRASVPTIPGLAGHRDGRGEPGRAGRR